MTLMPSPSTRHLSEDERQALADGSLAGDRARDANEHLRHCAACAADIAELEVTMKRIRAASPPDASVDEMWPAIRARIEQTKVRALPNGQPTAPFRQHRRIVGGMLLAAASIIAAVLLSRTPQRAPDRVNGSGPNDSLLLVSDSVQSYEAEARVLLDHLEVQRAMMRPEAAVIIDHDLAAIDSAITELQIAIANDPKNAALRRLLAESYRQKVELLKRAQNAG
jgi:hypothetical protein